MGAVRGNQNQQKKHEVSETHRSLTLPMYSQQCEVDWKSRGWGIMISNGSLKIGTAGRKWCTIIWNKSTVIFNASGICGAAGTTCTPLYRTRERVVISSAMCRCNGSQNFGTAGRKVCGIIWNKSRRRDSSQVHCAV